MNSNALSTRKHQSSAAAPERFTPLFSDAFLQIFGSADSAPVVQPFVNALLRAVGMAEVERIESITADAALPGGLQCKTPRLDIVMLCDDGRLVDLEAERRKVNVGNKSMFMPPAFFRRVRGRIRAMTTLTSPRLLPSCCSKEA